ncbi:hypothetical protein IAR55_001781 [Kwoniella newhampshirensis]|uniref:DNA mismatch repair proteins mutS family domain-containing protein n=1 Tax=Kwoniella newhampshirensis TaxID=1651941 RepID=A0AAW0Z343_9TREE
MSLAEAPLPSRGLGCLMRLPSPSSKERRAFVFFATHFQDLAITLGNLPGVVKLHLRTKVNGLSPDSPEFATTFSYKIAEGATTVQHYGLELAKLASLPSDVMEKATETAMQLSELEEQGKGSSKATAVVLRRKTLYELRGRLTQLVETSRLDNTTFADTLAKIQDSCRDTLRRCVEVIRSSDDTYEEA